MKHAWVLVCLAGGCAVFPFPQQVNRHQAAEFLQSGHDYLSEGLSDSAMAAFGMALEEDPELVEAHMGMGAIYRHRGDYDMASRSYERAVQLEPNNFQARYYLGWMQHLGGHIQEAIESYLRALAIHPDSFDANSNLAAAYLQQNRPGNALPYAIHATELIPDSLPAWANRATAHSQLEQYKEAVMAYLQAIELGEVSEPVLMGLANARIRLEQYDQAINVLQAINRASPNAEAYERIGYAYFKMRKFDEALTSFRAAIALGGERSVALNGVGVCLMAQYLQDGRSDLAMRDEALDSWRRSLTLRPRQPHIIDLLSRYQRL